VTGQNFVYVNGKLWAVEGDGDSHGGGGLVPGVIANMWINGKRAIGVGDAAGADALCGSLHGDHCNPSATTGDIAVGAT
jgi:uncharacterized Zn-binding protein involved in type VI secretion